MYFIDVDWLVANVLHPYFLWTSCRVFSFIRPSSFRYSLTSTEIFLFCVRNVRFDFDGKSYRQIDGAVMDCPLGPTLAGVILFMIEKWTQWHFSVTAILTLRWWNLDFYWSKPFYRYLSLFRSDSFLENEMHSILRFFLKTKLLRRSNETLQRSVHRKTTWSGQ